MKTLIQIVPVALIMGIIFFLSNQSGDSLPLPSFSGADKLAHMTAYSVLALSVLWFWGERSLDNPRRTVVLSVFFCVLYGISDEYHQSFVALRSVSIFDLLADTIGAFLLTSFWFRSPALQQRLVMYQNRLRALCRR